MEDTTTDQIPADASAPAVLPSPPAAPVLEPAQAAEPVPAPADGITLLGEHQATPLAPTPEDHAARIQTNRSWAITLLQQAAVALDEVLAAFPDAPGDNAVASARSQLNFCKGRIVHEARVIGEG